MAASTLVLEPATLDDVPAITELWFAVFTDKDTQHLFPDTSNMRKWWDEANRHDMIHKPFQKYIKIVDPNTLDKRGRPRLAAYAKWDTAMVNERGRRFPPWDAETPAPDADAFFNGLESERKRVMGDEKHYCRWQPRLMSGLGLLIIARWAEDLDMLGTHPDYRRRGAGAMLVKWGCDLADANGVGAYVDATKAGAPLYERYGFVDYSLPGSDGIASMARKR